MNQIVKGIYKYFKGGIYEVTNICENNDTSEQFVVYHNINNKNKKYIRSLTEFFETITKDGKTFPRFEFVFEFITDLKDTENPIRLEYNAKLDALNQPVTTYAYLLGQVTNGILSCPYLYAGVKKDTDVIDRAIDMTTKLIQENNKRYSENNSI